MNQMHRGPPNAPGNRERGLHTSLYHSRHNNTHWASDQDSQHKQRHAPSGNPERVVLVAGASWGARYIAAITALGQTKWLLTLHTLSRRVLFPSPRRNASLLACNTVPGYRWHTCVAAHSTRLHRSVGLPCASGALDVHTCQQHRYRRGAVHCRYAWTGEGVEKRPGSTSREPFTRTAPAWLTHLDGRFELTSSVRNAHLPSWSSHNVGCRVQGSGRDEF